MKARAKSVPTLVLSLVFVAISALPAEAQVVYATGLDGIELATFGPGGDFGTDLYVGTAGTDTTNGGIYTVSPSGLVTRTSITDHNAISIAFDTKGVLGGGMYFSCQGPSFGEAGRIYHVTPVGGGKFSTQVFADFSPIAGANKPWQITITSGENGFAAGMYLTSGPFGAGRSDTLYRVDAQGAITPVAQGFTSNEALVFAHGAYGDGMLITDIRGQQILRLLADGTMSTFATLGSTPFGPAVLAYGPDGFLYATDASSGDILRIEPDGSSSVFASLPLPDDPRLQIALAKPITATAGGFISGVYTASDGPTGLGTLYFVPVPSPSAAAALMLGGGAVLAPRRRRAASGN